MSNWCSLHFKPLWINDYAVSYSFILFFALLANWAVTLSRTGSAFNLKLRINIFVYFSYQLKHYICTISCASLLECKNILFWYSICCNFISASFPSIDLKINKVAGFSPDARIVKITIIL